MNIKWDFQIKLITGFELDAFMNAVHELFIWFMNVVHEQFMNVARLI